MRVAPASACDGEALTDLDRFHRLDAHQRVGEHAVDAAVPVHVRTEPRRHSVAEHFEHAAERVARLGGLLDLADHLGLCVGIEATHFGGVDRRKVVRFRPQ